MPQLPAKLLAERALALRYAYSLGVNLGMEDACHNIQAKTKAVVLDRVRNNLPLPNLRFCRNQASLRKNDATAREFLQNFMKIANKAYEEGYKGINVIIQTFDLYDTDVYDA